MATSFREYPLCAFKNVLAFVHKKTVTAEGHKLALYGLSIWPGPQTIQSGNPRDIAGTAEVAQLSGLTVYHPKNIFKLSIGAKHIQNSFTTIFIYLLSE